LTNYIFAIDWILPYFNLAIFSIHGEKLLRLSFYFAEFNFGDQFYKHNRSVVRYHDYRISPYVITESVTVARPTYELTN